MTSHKNTENCQVSTEEKLTSMKERILDGKMNLTFYFTYATLLILQGKNKRYFQIRCGNGDVHENTTSRTKEIPDYKMAMPTFSS
jgi:hypothetical protein